MSTNIVGGTIIWNLDIDSSKLTRGLDEAKAKVAGFSDNIKSSDNHISSFASNAQTSFSSIADGLGRILVGATALAATGSFGFVAMGKAAFDQVEQVQNATFALRAYASSGGEVNKILSQLVAYARSPLGTLFQRQDLFQSAQTLLGFGDAASKVVGHVEILSKAVALGYTNFADLSLIIGRVAQSGFLDAVSFDELATRGVVLSGSLRSTKITSDELYSALNKALPDKLLEGRATTIEGRMIRLQSAFRDLGGAILGVDTNTSSFIKGGLGDILVNALDKVRVALKDPVLISSFREMGKAIADFAVKAIPVLIKGFEWIVAHMKDIVGGFAALAAMFAAAQIAAVVLAVVAAPALLPFYLIAGAVILLIGALTFLQLRFNIFGIAITFMSKLLKSLGDFFVNLWNTIEKTFIAGWNAVINFFTVTIPRLINNIITWFAQLPTQIAKILGDLFLDFVRGLALIVGLFIFGVPKLISDIVKFFQKLPGEIWNILVELFNREVQGWTNIYNWIIGEVPKIITDIIKFFNEMPGKVNNVMVNTLKSFVTGFQNIWNSIVSEVSKWPGELYNWGANLMKSFADGIRSAIGAIANAFKDGMNAARKLVEGHSPPVEGPFKDIDKWGFNVGNAWVQGIQKAIGSLSLPTPSNIGYVNSLGSSAISAGAGSTTSITNAPAISINLGTFIGTETEKRKLAKMLQDSYQQYLKGRGQA